MGVSKNRGVSPKMDGENKGFSPIRMGWFGGIYPYFRKHPYREPPTFFFFLVFSGGTGLHVFVPLCCVRSTQLEIILLVGLPRIFHMMTQTGIVFFSKHVENIRLTSWYGSLSYYLQGLIHFRWLAGFLPSNRSGTILWRALGFSLRMSLWSSMWKLGGSIEGIRCK